MSALPTPEPHDVPDVSVRDVAIGMSIGGLSWIVRYLCSTEKQTLGYIARRVVTAGLTSLLVGMATKGYFQSEGISYAAAGACGYASPEILDYALAWLRSHSKGRTAPKG